MRSLWTSRCASKLLMKQKNHSPLRSFKWTYYFLNYHRLLFNSVFRGIPNRIYYFTWNSVAYENLSNFKKKKKKKTIFIFWPLDGLTYDLFWITSFVDSLFRSNKSKRFEVLNNVFGFPNKSSHDKNTTHYQTSTLVENFKNFVWCTIYKQ